MIREDLEKEIIALKERLDKVPHIGILEEARKEIEFIKESITKTQNNMSVYFLEAIDQNITTENFKLYCDYTAETSSYMQVSYQLVDTLRSEIIESAKLENYTKDDIKELVEKMIKYCLSK